jgi:hypothetical protein
MADAGLLGCYVLPGGVNGARPGVEQAQTLQSLSDERFVLGFGRSAPWRWRSVDKALSRAQLTELSKALPPKWLPSASAAGSVDECEVRLRQYLVADATEIILHGTTAQWLEGLNARFL